MKQYILKRTLIKLKEIPLSFRNVSTFTFHVSLLTFTITKHHGKLYFQPFHKQQKIDGGSIYRQENNYFFLFSFYIFCRLHLGLEMAASSASGWWHSRWNSTTTSRCFEHQ